MEAQDDPEIVALEQQVGTQFYTRLLGWIGATLATAGVTVQFPNDFAGKLATITIGLICLGLHELMARIRLSNVIQLSHAVGYARGLAKLPAAAAQLPAKTITAFPPPKLTGIPESSLPVPHAIPPPPAPKPLTDKIDS